MTAHAVQADKPITIVQSSCANYFCPVTDAYLYVLLLCRVWLVTYTSWIFSMLDWLTQHYVYRAYRYYSL